MNAGPQYSGPAGRAARRTFSYGLPRRFTAEYVDLFGNSVWDATRLKVQQKADEWRRQGFIGPTMASHAELAYTGIIDTLSALDREFTLRRDGVPAMAEPEPVMASR